MEILKAIMLITLLTTGWAGVQLLAKKAGTKNHIDNAGQCGNGCTCMNSGLCEKNDNLSPD